MKSLYVTCWMSIICKFCIIMMIMTCIWDRSPRATTSVLWCYESYGIYEIPSSIRPQLRRPSFSSSGGRQMRWLSDQQTLRRNCANTENYWKLKDTERYYMKQGQLHIVWDSHTLRYCQRFDLLGDASPCQWDVGLTHSHALARASHGTSGCA